MTYDNYFSFKPKHMIIESGIIFIFKRSSS